MLYDAQCGLCRRFKNWLAGQQLAPNMVRLGFVAAGSTEARQRYPELDHAATLREVTVVADDGAVYVGDRAWIVCLWATATYRGIAVRLAGPAMRPVARAIVERVAGLRSWNWEWAGGDYADGCDGQCDRQG